LSQKQISAMSNSQPYCELKKFVFGSKDEGRNPYRKEDGYIPILDQKAITITDIHSSYLVKFRD